MKLLWGLHVYIYNFPMFKHCLAEPHPRTGKENSKWTVMDVHKAETSGCMLKVMIQELPWKWIGAQTLSGTPHDLQAQ